MIKMGVPVLNKCHCPGQSQDPSTTWLSETHGSGEELEHKQAKNETHSYKAYTCRGDDN